MDISGIEEWRKEEVGGGGSNWRKSVEKMGEGRTGGKKWRRVDEAEKVGEEEVNKSGGVKKMKE